MKKRRFLYLAVIAALLIIIGAVLPREMKTIRLIFIVCGVICLLISQLVFVRRFGNIMTCPTCKTKFEWKIPVALKSQNDCITCPHCGTILENRNIK